MLITLAYHLFVRCNETLNLFHFNGVDVVPRGVNMKSEPKKNVFAFASAASCTSTRVTDLVGLHDIRAPGARELILSQ